MTKAPAMNWDHAVSWGRGVWVSVSDIFRVGQPELKHIRRDKITHIRRDKTRNPTPKPHKDHFARAVTRARIFSLDYSLLKAAVNIGRLQ